LDYVFEDKNQTIAVLVQIFFDSGEKLNTPFNLPENFLLFKYIAV